LMNKLNKKYKGVIIPMVTPFDERGRIDTIAVSTIVESFVQVGVMPFVLGTTGESFSVSDDDKQTLVEATVKAVKGRQTVFAGISSNCLENSIELAKIYKDLGADVMVAHQPFYFPMDDNQLLAYFEKLADAVKCPLILYNNPITTKQSIPLSVIEKLSYHSNIFGFKDSERGMERLNEAIGLWGHRPDFSHLLGWAAQSAYSLLHGSDGIIPSTGNLTPGLYADLYQAAIDGNELRCNELQKEADDISLIYQKDRNVSQSIPALKSMMSHMGICKPFVKSPMVEVKAGESAKIKSEMEALLILKN
jgi:dihydrodipicolinate synthase/N-acetylneuraminate lyase